MKYFSFLVIGVSFLLYQNCAPMHSPLTDSQESSSALQSVSVHEQTLYPLLKTNCASCHGATQQPLFATLDPELSYNVIMQNNLVDLQVANQSRFVTKISQGHSGFPTSLASDIETKIQEWIDLLKEAQIDIEAPAVMINSPSEGATISSTATVSVIATDNIGVLGVMFYIDDIQVGLEDITSPYSLSFNTSTYSGGTHFIKAVARDQAGNQSSSEISVQINNVVADTQPPVVNLTLQASGLTLTGTAAIPFTVSDNIGVAGVQVIVDNVAKGLEDTTAPFSLTLNTTALTNGSHQVFVRARDAAGNSTDSNIAVVNISNTVSDTVAPTVTLTSPLAGNVSGTVSLTATASDNVSVAGVQFLVNGAIAGAEDTTAPYSYNWNTTSLTNGNYTLSARARDSSGNVKTSTTVTVNVQNTLANPNATFTAISRDILVPLCLRCHGPTRADKGVRYDTYAFTQKTALAGNVSGSKLYSTCKSGSMPDGGPRLTATELTNISDWITAGALNN
jgi:cytochrome c553